MSTNATAAKEDPVNAARHCLEQLPYRMIVFSHVNQHGVPLYFVAGSAAGASRADNALKEAHRRHGGACFYCKKAVAEADLNIDHVEPKASGGKDHIQNLVIACRPCNVAKSHQPIEVYKPDAGREWLSAVLKQVQDRLNRL
jgi:hypothetical protein